MLTAGPQSRAARVTWQLSGHARRLVTLALAGLLIAVITRRAEFAGLAAPALAAADAAAGHAGQPPSSVDARRRAPADDRGRAGAAVLARVSGQRRRARSRRQAAPGAVDRRRAPPSWATTAGIGCRSAPERWGMRQVGTAGGDPERPVAAGGGRLVVERAASYLPSAAGQARVAGRAQQAAGQARRARVQGCRARASSSPGYASSCPATGSGGSTGRPRPGAARCSSTPSPPNAPRSRSS